MITKTMNMLFVIGWPLNIGGHIHSTLSYITELSKTGRNVYLLAQKGSLSEYFENSTVNVFYNRFLNRTKFVNLLAVIHIIAIVIRYRINIIHAQDFQALRPALIASKLTNTKLIFTKAGGELPSYKLPQSTKIIVFSEELLDGMLIKYNKNSAKNIRLIEPRIDTDRYMPIEIRHDFLRKYSLPENTREIKILMCARAVESKQHLIEAFLNTAIRFSRMRVPFTFIFSGNGILYDDISCRAERINTQAQRQLVFVTKDIHSIADIVRLYNYADIVIGHGRGIMEAMSCGKCVLCLGKNGKASLVTSNNVDIISYYNFSGRHFERHPELRDNIVDVITRLSKRSSERKELGNWGREYIIEHYSARLILDKLIDIYEDI